MVHEVVNLSAFQQMLRIFIRYHTITVVQCATINIIDVRLSTSSHMDYWCRLPLIFIASMKTCQIFINNSSPSILPLAY